MQPHARAPLNNSYLSADVFLMGGLSILICLASWAFMDQGSSVYTVSTLAVGLAFIVNDPHFLASYVLLYGDYRKKIFKDRRYFWAAVVVPLALGFVILTALLRGSADLMAHVISAMYFLVGWHYVKQTFGCVIVTSAQRGLYYQKWQRNLILFNLLMAWMMSWLAPHVQPEDFEYYGIYYYSLNLNPLWLQVVYALTAVSGLAVLLMQLRRYIELGEKPAPPAVAAFVSIYVWYLPVSYHSGFSYLIPFFHSLQYLAFVWQMKKNEITARLGHLDGRAWRAAWVRLFGGFGLKALLLGVLSFEFLPQYLDKQGLINSEALGTTPILVGVLLFINIHHYFIDNVIWRSDNEMVRAYLFQTRRPAGVQTETVRVA